MFQENQFLLVSVLLVTLGIGVKSLSKCVDAMGHLALTGELVLAVIVNQETLVVDVQMDSWVNFVNPEKTCAYQILASMMGYAQPMPIHSNVIVQIRVLVAIHARLKLICAQLISVKMVGNVIKMVAKLDVNVGKASAEFIAKLL